MKAIPGILIFLSAIICKGQNPYFQQSLDYKIKVRLNDTEHTLNGEIQMMYKNNSSDVLDKIGMHLWPNAYKNKETAFAKQKIRNDDLEFYEAPESDLGFIDQLDFKVNGIKSEFFYNKKAEDFGWLILPTALLPGDSILISTPFHIKIPYTYSRLGHVGQSYQITQWYPKPAVYDNRGWHLMSYLDQGEFYSEFGDYDVEISIPENYVVASTGVLQSDSELTYLENRIQETQAAIESKNYTYYPESASVKKFKTIRYIAQNVHDFAWFADKTFYVQKSEVILVSGKKISTWTFFNNLELWEESISYVNRAIAFYSQQVGEFPWPQATAVECALRSGGGMEYPMITAIGPAYYKSNLDLVIAHEIGHNWFYGILANNERDHPYLDEGIVSFYENRYLEKYYTRSELFDYDHPFKKLIGNIHLPQFNYIVYAREGMDQFPNQTSENFSNFNYGNDVYEKSTKLLKYAETMMGVTEFDQCIRSYYEKWKFKHPYPEDLQQSFKEHSSMNSDWLFDGFFNSNKKMDYRICKLMKSDTSIQLMVKNNAEINAPIIISAIKNELEIERLLVNGFEKTKKINMPLCDFDYVTIDFKKESFDLRDANNYIYKKGIFKKIEPLHVSMFPVIDQYQKTDIGITPYLGYNPYNGLQLGIYFSKALIPKPYWSIYFLPVFGLRNKDWAGMAKIAYNKFLSTSSIHNFEIGIKLKKYAYNQYQEQFLNYYQLSPFLKINFKHTPSKKIKSGFEYHFHWIRDEYISFKDSVVNSSFIDNINRSCQKLRYFYYKASILGDASFEVSFNHLQQNTSGFNVQRLLQSEITALHSFRYQSNRYINLRGYISFYPLNSERNSNAISSRSKPNSLHGSSGLAYLNYLDDQNEELFIGRSESNGIWSQQIFIKQGGFKLAPGAAQRTNIGNSNKMIAALNFSLDVPIKFIGNKIRPYFDFGYFEQSLIDQDDKFIYSAGINLNLIPKILDVYLPILNSNYIRTIYNSNSNHSYWKEITFSFVLRSPETKEILNFIGL